MNTENQNAEDQNTDGPGQTTVDISTLYDTQRNLCFRKLNLIRALKKKMQTTPCLH